MYDSQCMCFINILGLLLPWLHAIWINDDDKACDLWVPTVHPTFCKVLNPQYLSVSWHLPVTSTMASIYVSWPRGIGILSNILRSPSKEKKKTGFKPSLTLELILLNQLVLNAPLLLLDNRFSEISGNILFLPACFPSSVLESVLQHRASYCAMHWYMLFQTLLSTTLWDNFFFAHCYLNSDMETETRRVTVIR